MNKHIGKRGISDTTMIILHVYAVCMIIYYKESFQAILVDRNFLAISLLVLHNNGDIHKY